MIYEKKICPHCGYEIGINNYNRHIAKCDGSYKPKEPSLDVYQLDHDDLFCKFCGKECKNKNSLVQHELRCKENPNRKNVDSFSNYIRNSRKGKTKENCEAVAKQVATMKDKYANGYSSPSLGRKIHFDYLYKDHNNQEIGKWLNYVDSIEVNVPHYEITSHGRGEDSYNIIKQTHLIENNTVKLLFEHDYIANIYLGGTLKHSNTVHHIDKNKKNNDIHNLMVFNTTNDHKRYHNSKYAWLIYDEITHNFSCELKYDIIT